MIPYRIMAALECGILCIVTMVLGWSAGNVRADGFDELLAQVRRIEAPESRSAPEDDALARAVSEEAIEHRRQMLIRFAPTDPYWSPKRKNPKYQHPIAACRLALDPQDQEVLDYILYSLDYRGQGDDFSKSTLAGLFCRFGSSWSNELVEAVRREVTTYDGFLRGGTENHIAIRRTAGYLFGERFPDETFHHGLTGKQLADVCLKYIREYGRSLYASSQVEYLSPAYHAVNAAAWLNIVDFAEDDRAKLCGRAILDWLMADLAVSFHQGVIIPPLQREKGLLLERYQASYARSLTQFVAWLYFGGGNTPEQGNLFGTEKYAPYFPHGLCVDQFAVSPWRPDPVIRNIAAKRLALPYMLWQARGNWPCIEGASINQYGKTRPASLHDYPADPRYHLRSVYVAREYAIGSGNFCQNMKDPLLRTAVPFALAWKSTDDHNYLLVAHPYWYTQRKWEDCDEVLGDEDWIGISPFCQTVHWENAALVFYDLPERDPYGGDAAPGSPKFLSQRGANVIQSAFVYVPDSVDERTQERTCLFFREGGVYVAIRPFGEKARWEGSRHPGYMRLAMPGRVVGCAIEVGDREEFGSFEQFQRRICNTRLDTGRLETEKIVSYVSTRGHELRLRHKSPGWLPEAALKGTRLDFDRWPICESPYVRCQDRVLHVRDGHAGFTIDWRDEWPTYTRYAIVGGEWKITGREFIGAGNQKP